MKKTFNNQDVFDFISYEKSKAEHELERALNVLNVKLILYCSIKRFPARVQIIKQHIIKKSPHVGFGD